ncbi:hypothetical protein ACIQ34_08460 [Ureibacillus sp. NPDC094379]
MASTRLIELESDTQNIRPSIDEMVVTANIQIYSIGNLLHSFERVS